MRKQEYIIERLSERTGLSYDITELIVYAAIAIVGIAGMVAIKGLGWI